MTYNFLLVPINNFRIYYSPPINYFLLSLYFNVFFEISQPSSRNSLYSYHVIFKTFSGSNIYHNPTDIIFWSSVNCDDILVNSIQSIILLYKIPYVSYNRLLFLILGLN